MKFLGQVAGRALLERHYLDLPLAPSIWNLILQGDRAAESIDWFQELRHADLILYESKGRICFSSIDLGLRDTGVARYTDEELSGLDLSMVYESTVLGLTQQVPLVPGGETVAVTRDNAKLYLSLWSKQHLYSQAEPQITKFIEGFSELVPRQAIVGLLPVELELMICGQIRLEVEDLQAHMVFTDTVPHNLRVWFFESVANLSNMERKQLLKFTTGSCRVPMGGCRNFRPPFQVDCPPGMTKQHLPQAHTCFNQLDLPRYRSAHQLLAKLREALDPRNSSFFGFA